MSPQAIKMLVSDQASQFTQNLQTHLQSVFTQCKNNDALIKMDKRLRYSEVKYKSQLIAQHLQQLGLTSGNRVGVCLADGIDKALVYIGLLMAGISIVPIPIEEKPTHISQLINLSNIKYIISLQVNTSLVVNHIDAIALLTLEDKTQSWSIHTGQLSDEVLVELVWTPKGKLIELIYSQKDILAWLHTEWFTINHQDNIMQSMWWHLLQGKVYHISNTLTSYLNSSNERFYHLNDLENDRQPLYSTSIATLARKQVTRGDHSLARAYVDGGSLIYPHNAPTTVTHAMIRAGRETTKGLTVVNDKGEEAYLNYYQVLVLATRVTQGLQNKGLKARSAVILQCENLMDHFIAFWGCILGGYIPATVAIPPVYTRENAVVQKLVNIWQLLGKPVVISNDTNRDALVGLASANIMPQIVIVEVEKLKDNEQSQFLYEATGDDVVFYQLSSGSTGVPKCIQITHKAVIAHCEAAKQFMGYQKEDKWLNWLPVDHVGSMLMWHLQSVYLVCVFIQLSTHRILADPLAWIKQLSHYGISHTWSPNFGYQLVVEALSRQKEKSQYDLSSIKSMVNAGEQIQQKTVTLFIEKLMPYGLKANVISSAYGMAETSTAITYDKKCTANNESIYFKKSHLNNVVALVNKDTKDGVSFATNGNVMYGNQIRIVNKNNEIVSERCIGNLQVRGGTITLGYYNNEKTNKAAFTDDGWFDSGDLGFIYQKKLYITGREKEMIVVRGSNIYCYEVEAIISRIKTVASGYVGVFPLHNRQTGTEGFGIAYVGDNTHHTIKEIKRLVSQNLGISPDVILPIKKDDFPKTTSGKIQRSKIAQHLVSGDYNRQLKQLDIELADKNTLPDWFYQGVWQKAAIDGMNHPLTKMSVILLSEKKFVIPDNLYARYTVINQQEKSIDRILPQRLSKELAHTKNKVVIVDYVTHNRIHLAYKLAAIKILMDEHYQDLPIIWMGVYQKINRCIINAERGLFRSFAQERRHTHTVICDIDTQEDWLVTVEKELIAGFSQSSDIRYRLGQRSIYQLRCVQFNAEHLAKKQYRAGLSIVFGGLGGIGKAISTMLLYRKNQVLIIVGKSSYKTKQAVYEELVSIAERTASRVIYVQWDISSNDDFILLLKKHYTHWDKDLTTIVHTVGLYKECFLTEESEINLQIQNKLKINCTETIEKLLNKSKDRRNIDVIYVGSILGLTGAVQASGYSYGNSHMEGVIENSKEERRYIVSFGGWENTGINKDKQVGHLLRKKGIYQFTKKKGIQSLMMIIHGQQPGIYYVGIDAKKKDIHYYLTMGSRQKLITVEQCIPAIEQRLAFYLQCKNALNFPVVTENFINKKRLILKDKCNNIISKENIKGKLYIQADNLSKIIPTDITCQYNNKGMVNLYPQNNKYGGYTIDVDSLNNTMCRHKKVSQCYFIKKWDINNNEQLVAYLVLQDKKQQLNLSTVRSYLSSYFPHYMQASMIIFLDQLPLTPTGDVDHSILATMHVGLEARNKYVAPQKPVEKQLVTIWSTLLNIDRAEISINDSFFELGGDSLSLIQLIGKISQRFMVTLEVASLFEFSSLASMANLVEKKSTFEKKSSEGNTLSQAIALPSTIEKEWQVLVKNILDIILIAGYHFHFASKLKLDDWIHSVEKKVTQIVQQTSYEYPLIANQKGLFFIQQQNPSSYAYNVSLCMLIKGSLELTTFKKACQIFSDNHPALKTKFTLNQQKVPVQLIDTKEVVDFKLIDLCCLQNNKDKITEELYREARKPFKLINNAVCRFRLLQTDKESFYFLFIVHHIVIDGYSTLFIEQLFSTYQALMAGKIPCFPQQNKSFRHFCFWQNDFLNSKVAENQRQFWQRTLKGANYNLNLPTDRSPKQQLSHQGDSIYFTIKQQQVQQLKIVAKHKKIFLFSLLLSSYALLLVRYCQQEDIIIGTPSLGRNHPDLEQSIGYFVNLLPLRLIVNNTDNVATFSHYVFLQVLQALSNQDYPFAALINNVDMNSHQLSAVQTCFEFIDFTKNTGDIFCPLFDNSQLKYPSFTVKNNMLDFQEGVFKLSLTLIQHDDGSIRGHFDYEKGWFRPETIQCMARHYQYILAQIEDCFDKPLTAIELLDAQEKKQLLVNWNDVQADYPKDKCIHQLFEQQVKKNPHAIAIIFNDQQLNYQSLNTKANRLAHYLINQGIKPDDLVAICVERSPDMLIAILAVLKSGGAYVPIDPGYPLDRMDYILSDSQAKILLTNTTLQNISNKQTSKIIFLDDGSLLAKEPITDPVTRVRSTHLAYVIYTSGSTGKPKGVMMEHQAISNLVRWYANAFDVSDTSIIAQTANYVFDASVEEFFSFLSQGAIVNIVSKQVLLDEKALLQQLATVSHTYLPVQIIESLLKNNNWPQQTELKYIITGGEPLTQYNHQGSSFSLVNTYGPTEAGVTTTFALIGSDKQYAMPPIGKPINNVKVYILDAALVPVPISVVGELYIGGMGLARGYLNQPDLTQKYFIPNPFITVDERKKKENLRLYKTGDRCRWLPDGNIEYIGRIDQQIKIRGFRIECAEIEATIIQHASIKSSIVLLKTINNTKQLVAYCVAEKNKFIDNTKDNTFNVLDVSSIKNYLKQHLPEYMIPAVFIEIDFIPLTANAKVDKSILDRIDVKFTSDKQYVAPSTEKEKALVAIWQELLKVDRIGVNDSFFDLGGNSLTIITLINKMEDTLDKKVTIDSLFKYPTISSLLIFIESKQPVYSNIVKLSAITRNTTKKQKQVFFFHGVGGNLIAFYPLVKNIDYYLSKGIDEDAVFLGIEASGLRSEESIFSSGEKLVSNYADLVIKSLGNEKHCILAGWSYGVSLAFQVALKLEKKGYLVDKFVAIDGLIDNYYAGKALDLSRWSRDKTFSTNDFVKKMLSFYEKTLAYKYDDKLEPEIAFFHMLGYESYENKKQVEKYNLVAIKNILYGMDFKCSVLDMRTDALIINASQTSYSDEDQRRSKTLLGDSAIKCITLQENHHTIMSSKSTAKIIAEHLDVVVQV